MPKAFTLTFDVVTEDSARDGDFARHGFVTRNLTIPDRTYLPNNPARFYLRDAVDFLKDRDSEGPVEADCCPVSHSCPPRWFNYGGTFDPDAGGWLRVSLHLPDSVTPSTAMRIARLLGCYGVRN